MSTQFSREQLEIYGGMIAATLFSLSIVGGALVALELAMVVYGISAFLRTSRMGRKGRLRFIMIGIALLITSATDTCLDIRFNFQVLFQGGPTGMSYYTIGPKIIKENRIPDLIGNVALGLTVLIGDLLMLWRCYVIWGSKKLIIVIPSLACIASTVLYWVYIITGTNPARILLASISLTITMNIIVTLLILLRVGLTWRRTAKAMPDRKLPTMYTSIVAIVVESAAPLTFFGICWIISKGVLTSASTNFVHTSRIQVVNRFSNWLYYLFCAISPQMIIVRVTAGKSWKDAEQSDHRETVDFSQPIHFAKSERIGSITNSLGSA